MIVCEVGDMWQIVMQTDHAVSRAVQRGSHRGDRLPLDQHVRHVVIHGGNDAPAFDQHAHHATADPWNCGMTSPP